MKLIAALLLALVGAAVAERPLYTLQGSGVQGALLRQAENEDALKLSQKYMHVADCKSKVGNMDVSPFTFYRGSNQLFFRDMHDQGTVKNSAFYDPVATPWIQGDMHVLNAGRFDNSKGAVVYDVNDFDESWVANYLYDVYRLAASIVLVARNNSLTDDEAVDCVETFAAAYRDQLKKLAKDESSPFTLDVDRARGMVRSLLQDKAGNDLGTSRDEAKLRKKMLDKWAPLGDDKLRRFNRSSPNFADVTDQEWDEITAAVEAYTDTLSSVLRGNKKYFKVVDIARRLNAGTGSLGTSRYYVLVRGATKDPNDDRILDVKHQGKPAVYPYLTEEERVRVDNNVDNDADRAVQAYLSMVRRPDEHLGYMKIFDNFFSVRERSPYKKALELTGLDKATLDDLCEQWGIMLANTHERSVVGNSKLGVPPSFATVVTDSLRGRRKEFLDEVSHVAVEYAKQVDHDYALFLNSQAEGKLCN